MSSARAPTIKDGEWPPAPRIDRERPPLAAPPANTRPARDLFADAVRHHVAGESTAAEVRYREALLVDPAFAEASNNLGVLVRSGRADEAHELFARAAATKPTYLEARFNLALSHMHRGELAAAADEFRAVLALDPDNGRAATDLSSVLRGLGEYDESLAMARRGVTLIPGDPATHNNLGNILLETGRLAEAKVAYERALALNPDYPEATNNLGTTYRGLREPEKAAPLFVRALDLRPGYIDAMHNLALAMPPGVPGADQIEPRLRAEVARFPDRPDVQAVLAVHLQEAGRYAEARTVAQQVVDRDPSNADCWTVLGICAAEDLDPREAIRCYDRALATDPRLWVTRWNRAIALLSLGEYVEGWREYESRWHLVNMVYDRRVIDAPEWSGEPVEGRTMLIYTEQGLGDAIQFARFGSEVKRRFAPRIIVECDVSLVSLFQSCDWVDGVVARGSDRPSFDTHVALLSLPRILGLTLDTIPTDPAFQPPERPIARRVVREPGVLNVGLVWGGRSPNPALARRSVPLEQLSPLATLSNVRLYGLQLGDTSGQLERCSFREAVTDLSPYIADFVDTAAAMRQLDLVITIDTSVAHLAGALGVPVWVMLIHNADWRWLIDRSDSPWYPSATLFRQTTAGDWSSVVAAVRDRLASWCAPERTSERSSGAMVELPSLQRDENGDPRFTLSIPLADLATDDAFAAYSLELAGDGVDAEARNFLDAELRADDLMIDIGGGWGLTALGAATAPTVPASVVAVTSSPEVAAIVANGAGTARRGAPLRTIVRSEAFRIDDVVHSEGRGRRVLVRAHQPTDLIQLLPGAAAALTDGSIAGMIWTLAGESRSVIQWGDQLAAQTLSSLGFEHFEMVEDEAGALLQPLGDAPSSRVVFSLRVERFQEQPADCADVSMPILGMDWQIGATSGWGVYGLNLASRLLSTGRALPAPLLPPSSQGLGAEASKRLEPVFAAHAEFSSALANGNGAAVGVSFLMLRALGNGLCIAPHSAPVDANRNVGVVFFESTDLDDAAIARAKRFDRIIAGSTWNAEVLRAHGVDTVRTVLQGIDASVFKARAPRARRADRFVIFSGGKLEYRKGQDIVVAAFREFVKRHPEAKLMVAWHNHWPQTMGEIGTAGHVSGVPAVDAGGRADIRQWLASNGIPEGAIIDLGLRGNGEMASLMADADVALFTNRAEGGTNLVAMESLAAGVPTILSANTGHLDLVDDARCYALRAQGACRATPSFRGVDGWGESSVEEAVEALETVYRDPDGAARRAARAAEWMQRLTWDHQIDRLYEEIADLL